MENVTVFRNEQFGQVRTTIRGGEPWFVAADVCKALDIDPTATRRLDEDEKITLRLTQGESNRTSSATIVNEPGLYALVLGSRKPEARAFKRWITHEVIPSIRKSGGYIAGQEDMSDADLMAKALLVAQRQIEQRDAQITEMQPKALFADAVNASKTSILVNEMAKLLRQNGVAIGEKKLFKILRGNGYLCSKGELHNCPTQRAMDMGLFEIKETAITTSDGSVILRRTPKVTGKGQVYFINKFELVFISKTWYNSSMEEVRAGRKPYPTDLTDSQWKEIEPLYSGMRNRKWSKRELTNAVLYIVKTGCQWRQLPHDFPPYQTVYSFFSRGAKSGLWEKILAHLVEKTRKDAGKSAEPHYALIDSQSVKTVADNEARGIDGGKKQKGANGMPS